MEQNAEANKTIDSLREPLLVKESSLPDDDENSLIEDDVAKNGNHGTGQAKIDASSKHTDGVDVAIVENIGSLHTCYVIGQWVWLYLAWSYQESYMRDFHLYDFAAMRDFHLFYSASIVILAWAVVMAGHCFFLVKLSILFPNGEVKESPRPAQLNQETLPIILSALRVFCMDRWAQAEKFFGIIGLSFLLFELCMYSFGCSVIWTLARKHNIFFVEYCEQKQQKSNDRVDNVEKQHESSESQTVEENEFGSRMKLRGCNVIIQWIWLLSAWGILRLLFEEVLFFSLEYSSILTWVLAMCGHGMLLVVTKSLRKRSSFFRVDRETVPIIMSGLNLFTLGTDPADEWLAAVAICFVISLTARVVKRFVLNMTFTTFAEMEKDYLEQLKEQDAEEAAQLEAQMQRMAYLEAAPRPNPAKRRRRLLMMMFGPAFICFGLIIVVRCVADLALERIFPLFAFLGDNTAKLRA